MILSRRLILPALLLLGIEAGCRNVGARQHGINTFIQPAGTIVASEESDATHRLSLRFLMLGQTEVITRYYYFKLLAQPAESTAFLHCEAEHGDGIGGWYSLSISPEPLTVFKNNLISFQIEYARDWNGVRTNVLETFTIPLLKSAKGIEGLVSYETDWSAYQNMQQEGLEYKEDN